MMSLKLMHICQKQINHLDKQIILDLLDIKYMFSSKHSLYFK